MNFIAISLRVLMTQNFQFTKPQSYWAFLCIGNLKFQGGMPSLYNFLMPKAWQGDWYVVGN